MSRGCWVRLDGVGRGCRRSRSVRGVSGLLRGPAWLCGEHRGMSALACVLPLLLRSSAVFAAPAQAWALSPGGEGPGGGGASGADLRETEQRFGGPGVVPEWGRLLEWKCPQRQSHPAPEPPSAVSWVWSRDLVTPRRPPGGGLWALSASHLACERFRKYSPHPWPEHGAPKLPACRDVPGCRWCG